MELLLFQAYAYTLLQVFSCELREVFKKAFFKDKLRATASFLTGFNFKFCLARKGASRYKPLPKDNFRTMFQRVFLVLQFVKCILHLIFLVVLSTGYKFVCGISMLLLPFLKKLEVKSKKHSHHIISKNKFHKQCRLVTYVRKRGNASS